MALTSGAPSDGQRETEGEMGNERRAVVQMFELRPVVRCGNVAREARKTKQEDERAKGWRAQGTRRRDERGEVSYVVFFCLRTARN